MCRELYQRQKLRRETTHPQAIVHSREVKGLVSCSSHDVNTQQHELLALPCLLPTYSCLAMDF